MKLSIGTILALLFLSAPAGRAEDWTTNDGRTHQVVSVTGHDGASVTILEKRGNYTVYTTLPLSELSSDLQKKFHYDAKSAALLKAQQEARDMAARTDAQGQQRQDALYQKAKEEFDSLEKAPVGGRVFLTTKEGEIVKLGTIHIYLFSEDQAREAMAVLGERASSATQAMQTALDEQKAACKKLKEEVEGYQGNPDGDEFKVIAQAYIGELKRYRSLLGNYYRYYSQGYNVAGLPKALAEAKTDAKGKFFISVPKSGAWVLGAYDQPEASKGGGYFWLVKIGGDVAGGNGLFLGNYNLASSDAFRSMAKTMDQETIDQIIATADGLLKSGN